MPVNYQIVDYSKQTTGIAYEESHVTLYCQFLVDNTPVYVENPTFELRYNSNPVSNLYLLTSLHRSEDKEGYYKVTFLTNGLQEGDYEVYFSGIYEGNLLEITGSLTLKKTPRVQYLIDMLHTSLGATYDLKVPKQYLIYDPNKHFWEDGKLYSFLQLALKDINAMPPLSTGFTLEDVPITNYLIMGAQIYAIMSIVAMEIGAYFDVSVPIRINLYKGDKWENLARFYENRYLENLRKWKRYYTFITTRPGAITSLRIPYRVLRPLCTSAETNILKVVDGKEVFVPITDIKPGDVVVTKDGYDTVISFIQYKINKMFEITLNNNEVIRIGVYHPLLTKDNKWKRAYELEEGEYIKTLDYPIKIKKKVLYDNKEPVYDLETLKYHNYIIDNYIISHNSMVLYYSSLFPY